MSDHRPTAVRPGQERFVAPLEETRAHLARSVAPLEEDVR